MLHQLLSGYEEEVKKKDRMIQSSRLIIKFRESTIAKLEKNAKNAGTEPVEDPANVRPCLLVCSFLECFVKKKIFYITFISVFVCCPNDLAMFVVLVARARY